MSRKCIFDTGFWSDPWVVDHLSIVERQLFMYLFMNEHGNIAGVYEISLRTISNETGFEAEEVVRMMKRLEPKVQYSNGWIIVRNAIKNQNYKSPNVAEGIKRVIEHCPQELVEFINWPSDFGIEKPKGSTQTQLIANTLDDFFDEKKTTVDKKPAVLKSTPNRENRPSSTVGGTKLNLTKLNTAVTTRTRQVVDKSDASVMQTAATTGKKYFEISILYEDLSDLVNDTFKAWYCQTFFKLGRERVQRMASEAKADARQDKRKLFSHMLKEALKVAK